MSELNLFIFRHGIAQEKGSRYPDDRKRPLTAEGAKEVRKAARAMKGLKLKFDVIYSSDYKRAEQTAVIVADVLNAKKKLRYVTSLRSEADSRLFLTEELGRAPKKLRNVLAIGHEPQLSSMLSFLVFRRPMKGIRLKKAGLAKLTLGKTLRAKAQLKWLLTPRQLCLMAPS